MTKLIIGIQGASGSFSEVAAKQFIKDHQLDDTSIDYLISSKNVLAALTNQTIQYGVLAIENAQGGVVRESIYALAAHQCHIIKLFHIPISQNLLVKPGIRLTDISAIYSHRQALRQCHDYLCEHHWGCELIEADDTAAAAQRLSANDLPETAAVIGNAACAELYNLNIIAADIHDLKNNLTLFAAVERRT